MHFTATAALLNRRFVACTLCSHPAEPGADLCTSCTAVYLGATVIPRAAENAA